MQNTSFFYMNGSFILIAFTKLTSVYDKEYQLQFHHRLPTKF
uniref:Transportin-1 isoform X2 n=1 Tax=Rhizophora mucronata TaxID=61149 RepID=A0A2P2MHK0_RHIMU